MAAIIHHEDHQKTENLQSLKNCDEEYLKQDSWEDVIISLTPITHLWGSETRASHKSFFKMFSNQHWAFFDAFLQRHPWRNNQSLA